MPFRDPISFLVLPPGVTPPVVGQSIIFLDPGPPSPQIMFFTGDADEEEPAAIHTETGLAFGRMAMHLFGPIHDGGTSQQASIELASGTDGNPDSTLITLNAGAFLLVSENLTLEFDLDGDGQVNLLNSFIIDTVNDLMRIFHPLNVRESPVTTRIATTKREANSAAIGTTETTIDSVTAALTDGMIVRIRCVVFIQASVAADDCQVNIREDNASGTILTAYAQDIPITTRPLLIELEAEYEATATGNKTFVTTLDTVVGAGNMTAVASATRPSFLYVDYIREA